MVRKTRRGDGAAGLLVLVAVFAVHLGAVAGGGFRKFSLSELEEAARAREDREGLRDVSTL